MKKNVLKKWKEIEAC